jgi:hypothetical protein
MLNGIVMEASQMNGPGTMKLDVHAVHGKAAGQTMVGKNLVSINVLRPGSQTFVSPLALYYSLQDQYKIRTERGHYTISPTTFVVIDAGQQVEITVEPQSAPRAVTLVFD